MQDLTIMSDYVDEFKPAFWLKNAHLQTIWPSLFKPQRSIHEQWERVELPDGDFIDLVWKGTVNKKLSRPIVILLHGLGGNLDSSYLKGLMKILSISGFKPVLMHFRGSSGVPNRLPRGYHSGETQDISYVVKQLQNKYPDTPIHAVGFSLGGNVLLKWLGETGESNPLTSAVAISVPFVLETVADTFMKGFARVYQWKLLKQIKKETLIKFNQMPSSLDLSTVEKISSFWEFDDYVTASLNGFSDVHDYYRKSGCRQYLGSIKIPTLIIHSLDDPFITPEVVPNQKELSSSTVMDFTEYGGHVGFIEGKIPLNAEYWLEKRIPAFLSQFLSPS